MPYLVNFVDNPGFQHLAEEIFSNLDCETLNRCRLLSKAIKDFINNSKPFIFLNIQKAISESNLKHIEIVNGNYYSLDIFILETSTLQTYDVYEELLSAKLKVEDLIKILNFLKNKWTNPFPFPYKCNNGPWDVMRFDIFYQAFYHNSLDIVEILLEHSIWNKDSFLRCFHTACRDGRVDMVELFLNCNLNSSTKCIGWAYKKVNNAQ